MSSFHEAVQKEIGSSQVMIEKVFKLSKGQNLSAAIVKERGGTKEDMANLVFDLVKQFQKCVQLLSKASAEVELSQREAKSAADEIISLQRDLLECKTLQIEDFQVMVNDKLEKTLKTELKTYSEAVSKNTHGESLTIRNIKTVVKNAVKNAASSSEREKNLIVFGLEDDSNDEPLHYKVEEMLSALNQKSRFEAIRIGSTVGKRPVKVSFDRSETVYDIMKVAKNLKTDEKYRNVYLSMDRTPEQRAERKKLVEKMKAKIKEHPNRKFYIKSGTVHCEAEEEAEEVQPKTQDQVKEKQNVKRT